MEWVLVAAVLVLAGTVRHLFGEVSAVRAEVQDLRNVLLESMKPGEPTAIPDVERFRTSVAEMKVAKARLDYAVSNRDADIEAARRRIMGE